LLVGSPGGNLGPFVKKDIEIIENFVTEDLKFDAVKTLVNEEATGDNISNFFALETSKLINRKLAIKK